ncbi:MULTISPECIES: hypothetical protein [unclassified Herbaspirillum]|uniref:hypothetical protein n=1 Tax=unclassified Herbaspirillum TaxID=2624150 RepID=UPI001071D126|nr:MULTISPECIES: hypothetical protein [unclassified Herbaspirillum]TFI08305.1 hypothetical protein E4P32_09015 [Herbaspirillum sp. 3R11]TFI14720.1 hypothetical protein E4P31_09010 [Herbaspirillum sp. 3R-11]TFI31888.1 hypothetical protein E4P30_00140 [Herbaspirillum sp. 3C11]TFI32029.1 hypothetical protein E4P30_00900 [Herbaspirillum sp. 3C11]
MNIVRYNVLITCALLSASHYALAQETLRPCSDPPNGIPPGNLPWLPFNADKNACNQLVIFLTSQSTNASDQSTKIAAFKSRNLVAIRPYDEKEAGTLDLSAPWDESGSIGPVGELWWGRRGTNNYLVGQESYYRLSKGVSGMLPAELQQAMEEGQVALAALKAHRPAPPSPTFVDRSGLFSTPKAIYKLKAATQVIFYAGSGGYKNEKPIAPGTIREATLELDTATLQGKLMFVLLMDGVERNFTIPVKRNIAKGQKPFSVGEKFRLRAVSSRDSEIRCYDESPEQGHFFRDYKAAPSCAFPAMSPSKKNGYEFYDLYGAFFGDHAKFAAVQIQLGVDSPLSIDIREHGGYAAGSVIVLQRLD